MIVASKTKGEMQMVKKEKKDIESIIKELTTENKRCALAVANALIFSQNHKKCR